jgi:hypothetical protein
MELLLLRGLCVGPIGSMDAPSNRPAAASSLEF